MTEAGESHTADVIVIGGGPAGLAAGQMVTEHGYNATVIESQHAVGGMAKSFRLWDRVVDVGPHRFFSRDPRVNRWWLKHVGGEYHMVSRKTRILYKGRFFVYPIELNDALRNLGLVESVRSAFSFLIAKLRPFKDESTFDKWVTKRFGKRLFSIFFESYTEKLWGIPTAQLDSEFAAQRIKKLSLFQAFWSAISGTRRKKHRTLVDEFAYPNDGAGAPYQSAATAIEKAGGSIVLGEKVIAIAESSGRWEIRTDKNRIVQASEIVSTMPLTTLVKLLRAPSEVISASERLRFRNTILVYLKVSTDHLFGDQWLYVQSAELRTGRITNFNNWGAGDQENYSGTVLCFEYWCFDDDALWQAGDDELEAIAREDFVQSRINENARIEQTFVLRVPKCYPVYDKGYREDLRILERFIDNYPGLAAIGRYGAFKYNNQDHSILMGLLAAENICEGTNHDLWGVNADDEYQESSLITETGLAMDHASEIK